MKDAQTVPAPELTFPVPKPGKWERERAAFAAMHADLLNQYRDRYVAVHEGQVVASGSDKIHVALQAYQEYGRLLNQLGERDAAADAYRAGLGMVTEDALPAIPHLDAELR